MSIRQGDVIVGFNTTRLRVIDSVDEVAERLETARPLMLRVNHRERPESSPSLPTLKSDCEAKVLKDKERGSSVHRDVAAPDSCSLMQQFFGL